MDRSQDRQARKRICRNMAGQHPLELARALVDKGESDAALTELTTFLNTDFYNDEALFMLGSIFIEKGMNGLGAVLTTSAINSRMADGRSFPEAMMNLGAAFKAENDIQSAHNYVIQVRQACESDELIFIHAAQTPRGLTQNRGVRLIVQPRR